MPRSAVKGSSLRDGGSQPPQWRPGCAAGSTSAATATAFGAAWKGRLTLRRRYMFTRPRMACGLLMFHITALGQEDPTGPIL